MRLHHLSVLALGACVLDLRVDKTVRISCDDGAACPKDFSCRASVCVHDEVQDFDGPRLALVSVTPQQARAGTEITIVLVADEPLIQPPTLRFADGGEIRALGFVEETSGNFVFRYRVSGEEQPGDHALEVSATDAAGNTTAGLLGGALAFDFSAPALVGTPSFAFTPAADNPLLRVSALTIGTELDLNFVTNEIVVPPIVSVVPDALVFTRLSGEGTGHAFALDPTAGAFVDGVYEARATLVDLAGNSVTIALGTITVDTSSPQPPLTSTITFHRRPWGDAASALPTFSLHGTTASVEAASTVIVYANAAGTAELFRLNADASGAFGSETAAVPTDDRSRLFLAAVDSAGNVGPVVPVRDFRFTAALGGDFTNPHSLSAHGRFRPHLFVRGNHPVAPSGRLSTASEGTWRQVAPGSAPNLSYRDPDLAFDFARGELVLRGGADLTPEAQTSSDQWILRNGHWEAAPPIDIDLDGEPTRHAGSVLVYDPARTQIVMLPDASGVTWTWTGLSWRRITGGVVPPGAGALPARTQRAASDDPQTGEIVMLVGAPFFETWSFDGTLWTKRCDAACAGPHPTGFFDMTTDHARNEILVLADGTLWAWTNGAWQIRRVCSDATCPQSRTDYAIAYDHKRQRTVLYGGCHAAGCNQVYLDTWEWDGMAWSCSRPATACDPLMIGCNPAGSQPTCNRALAFADGGCTAGEIFPAEPRSGFHASLTYDQNLEQLVLAGGARFCSVASTAWRYEGNIWTRLNGGGPVDPGSAVAFYDDTRAIAFGGAGAATGTWRFDGAAWSQEMATGPTGRENAALAYDPVRDAVLLFGGESAPASTWEWSLADGWTERCTLGEPCTAQPTAFATGALAFHPGLAGTVWVGAPDAGDGGRNEVWLWKDADWTRIASNGSGPRVDGGGAMAWHAASGQLLFHGGNRQGATLDEYWLNGGTGWTGGSSTERERHALAADPLDGTVRLFAGESLGGCPDPFFECHDLLRFDGAAFSVADVAASNVEPVPAERGGHSAAASAGGLLLVTGGRQSEQTSNGLVVRNTDDAWLWLHPLTAGPAHVFGAAFLAANAGEGEELVGLEVDWVAGATLAKTGGAGTIRLWVWDRVAWRPTSVAHLSAVPSALHWRSVDDPLWANVNLHALLAGDERTVYVAATVEVPSASALLGANGARHTLASDVATVTFRYRRAD